MPNPLEELKTANDAYHAAVNKIFRLKVSDVFCDGVEELAEIKADFGSRHTNIFQLMAEAQVALEPLFEEGD